MGSANDLSRTQNAVHSLSLLSTTNPHGAGVFPSGRSDLAPCGEGARPRAPRIARTRSLPARGFNLVLTPGTCFKRRALEAAPEQMLDARLPHWILLPLQQIQPAVRVFFRVVAPKLAPYERLGIHPVTY